MSELDPEDVSFFVGKTLSVVTISMHQIILIFDDDLTVNCESPIAHINRLEMRDEFEFFGNAASVICQLLERTVEGAKRTPEGSLLLDFSNGETIELTKKEQGPFFYESYVITYKGGTIVV